MCVYEIGVVDYWGCVQNWVALALLRLFDELLLDLTFLVEDKERMEVKWWFLVFALDEELTKEKEKWRSRPQPGEDNIYVLYVYLYHSMLLLGLWDGRECCYSYS